jgi:CheY-like chemotaxis protein
MNEPAGRVICVVDDNASLRRSLRNLLMSVGFRVRTFDSAEAFLEGADRESIGCVVLDVRMTGMSSIDLLRHLAATGPCIPMIILTPHADDDRRRRSRLPSWKSPFAPRHASTPSARRSRRRRDRSVLPQAQLSEPSVDSNRRRRSGRSTANTFLTPRPRSRKH